MTREQTISTMIRKALAITGKNSDKWTREAENEIWEICYEWNREHYNGVYENAEIFMCEIDGDNGIEGFYIEDDYYLYAA